MNAYYVYNPVKVKKNVSVCIGSLMWDPHTSLAFTENELIR